MKKIVIIRGAPATGKTTLAEKIIEYMNGKKALISYDEFLWVMTAHHDRDKEDYRISMKNYLSTIRRYMEHNYLIVTENCFDRVEEKSYEKLVSLAEKQEYDILKILLTCSFDEIRKRNNERPTTVEYDNLKHSYNSVYDERKDNEHRIDTTNISSKDVFEKVKRLLD